MNSPRIRGSLAFLLLAGTSILICLAASAQQSQPAAPPAGQPQQGQPPAPPPDVAAGDAAFRQQDWNAASEHYRRAIESGVCHGIVHMRLGYALHLLGRYEEALPHHLRAGAFMHPEIRIDGLYNAACASALLGRKDQALEYLAKAIDAGFSDTTQVNRDTDLDSLRDDDRFKKLVAGIGKTPRLHEQMNFFIGAWTQTVPEHGVVANLKITRPLANSYALVSESTNQGSAANTGMLWPDFNERVWRWTEVDGLGGSRSFTGRRGEDGSITFTGCDLTATGPGVHIRLTFTPEADGSVREKVEVSEDEARTWRVHHEEKYVKKAE